MIWSVYTQKGKFQCLIFIHYICSVFVITTGKNTNTFHFTGEKTENQLLRTHLLSKA